MKSQASLQIKLAAVKLKNRKKIIEAYSTFIGLSTAFGTDVTA